ncbi:MAG: hypothetical protein QG656_2744 [Candidatus Hydrogenedentes bacterium]|nr:hypothetical protein [Candidatus Hydrogenedentota bacterium]
MSKENRLTIAVCGGKSCLEKNAKKLRSRLETLADRPESDGKVRVEKCTCLGSCKKAPVVEVNPGHRLFVRVKPKNAEDFLDELLENVPRRKVKEAST